MEQSNGIKPVVTTHEPGAVFAADAYGRLNGLGVVLVTYGVGGFNIMNGVACAYAESSPLLVISGGPPTQQQLSQGSMTPLSHHIVKHSRSQLDAFKSITAATFRMESINECFPKLSAAVDTAKKQQLPVYLEIPTDLMTAEIEFQEVPVETAVEVHLDSLEAAVKYFRDRIDLADHPVLYLGAEFTRYKLQPELEEFLSKQNLPVVTSVLGKAVIDETSANFMGIYAGVISQDEQTRALVEDADLVIMLGVKITDVNCGAFTADLRKDCLLIARPGWIGDGYSAFQDAIPFDLFFKKLAEDLGEKVRELPAKPDGNKFDPENQVDQYLSVINEYLTDIHTIVADTGDSCYSSLFLTTRRQNGYMAPTFYNTMGFSIPAAIGVQFADLTTRPVILVGDGAFQMTGMEMSCMSAFHQNPIIILFNNSGYGMQRVFVDGPFNDIPGWDYQKITEGVGAAYMGKVKSPTDLERALTQAEKITGRPSLIEVIIPKGIISSTLARFGQAFAREKHGICPLNTGEHACEHEDSCSFCRASIWT